MECPDNKRLGVFNSSEACAAKVATDPDCTCGTYMWHDVLSSKLPAWGCRCCQISTSHARGGCPDGWDCSNDGAAGRNPRSLVGPSSASRTTTLLPAPAIELMSASRPIFLRVKHGLCLEAVDRFNSGGTVHMKPCQANDAGQMWLYDKSIGQIRAGSDGKCLDASQRHEQGGLVHLFECATDNPNQAWDYNDVSGILKAVHGI